MKTYKNLLEMTVAEIVSLRKNKEYNDLLSFPDQRRDVIYVMLNNQNIPIRDLVSADYEKPFAPIFFDAVRRDISTRTEWIEEDLIFINFLLDIVSDSKIGLEIVKYDNI